MFGDNPFKNFGIPDFPFDGIMAQGGMFGPNAPAQDLPGSQMMGEPASAGGPAPGAGSPPVGPLQPTATSSPLAPGSVLDAPRGPVPGPLSRDPGQGGAAGPLSRDPGPPAAGANSLFGKPEM